MNFVAIDFEMPNNFSPKICAYGAALIQDGEIVQTAGSLVNPQTSFEDFIIDLTGITPSMVAAAPTFPLIWDKLKAIIDEADIIIAHNAVCDLSILARCLNHYGIQWKERVKYICTCEMGTRCFPDLGKYSLKALCEHLDIPLDNHSADSDSIGCARLLIDYLERGMDSAAFIKEFDMVNCAVVRNGVVKKKKSVTETVRNTLHTMSSTKNKEKAEKRLADINPDKIIGTPINKLYMVAKQMRQKNNVTEYIEALPHEFHEENDLHAIAVSGIRNEKKCIDAVKSFLPYVDNCEVCDLLCPQTFIRKKGMLCDELEQMLTSDSVYTVRFALNMLINILSKTDIFIDYFDMVLDIGIKAKEVTDRQTDYFVTALIKHPAETVFLLKTAPADKELINRICIKAENNIKTDGGYLAQLISLAE